VEILPYLLQQFFDCRKRGGWYGRLLAQCS